MNPDLRSLLSLEALTTGIAMTELGWIDVNNREVVWRRETY